LGAPGTARYTAATVTPRDYARAHALLIQSDPVLAAVIGRIGPCRLAASQHDDHFAALLRSIVGQQLSTKAAATIHRRLLDLLPPGEAPSPGGVLATPLERLRAAGLSARKAEYVRDLAARVHDGRLDLVRIAALPDEQVIAELSTLKGVGRWTAEMFLIFRLHRPDVLPLGDLGILKAVQRLYGFRRLPAARTVERVARRWQPYRSVACWYLWAALDNAPAGDR
jgi:DNA-3-methyladenine glycosylase II